MHRKTSPAFIIITTVFLSSIIIAGTLPFLAGYILRSTVDSNLEKLESSPEYLSIKQKHAVTVKRQEAERHLNRLSKELDRLKTHVKRINELGTRMTKTENLDPSEFNLDTPPTKKKKEKFLNQLSTLDNNLNKREKKLTALEIIIANGKLKSDSVSATKRHLYSASIGTHIYAVASGVVTVSGYRKGFGNMIEINHNKGLSTRYNHNRILLVKAGEKVRKGQKIALMGSTGRSIGSHVHYEMLKNGKTVSPHDFKLKP